MATVTERKTAEQRREQVLDAALEVFAEHGLSGASSDEIARRAGISQPYLFRLFRTKKELFMASCRRCLAETLEMFRAAAEGKTGEEALQAMGQAYTELIQEHPARLRGQLQSYMACEDPEIAAVVHRGFGDIVEFVGGVSGVDPARLSRFFARGMLINVLAAMEVLDSDEPWAKGLVEGCKGPES